MIFVTGDTHGDFRRFSIDNFPEQKEMSKEDYVIVCGDFGIWDNSKSEHYWLNCLNDKPFTTLFVAGNHSNYDLLKTFSVEHWSGGNVQFIRESVIHLMRGQVFNISGKRIFTMGGASSHDIQDGILEVNDPEFKEKRKALDKRNGIYRINHISWWAEELPCDSEYDTAKKNLDACNWNVDYIVSHCCPSSIVDILSSGFYQHDKLTDFFEEVKEKCNFDYWFFGHYHDNRILMQKYLLLYEQIIQINL